MNILNIFLKSFWRRNQLTGNKRFILSVMVCNFLISAEYGITRPASSGVFLTLFSAKYFPFVWICTVPINLFIIYLYNKFLPKYGCKKTFCYVASAVIFVNTIAALGITQHPIFCFFQFIWKDIYILLMFKQMWSMIHTTIDQKKAKYIYGIFFGIGGLGSTIGGCAPSFLAIIIGSQTHFFFTLPIYLIIILFYLSAYKRSKVEESKEKKSLYIDTLPKKSFSLVFSSRLLFFVLLIVTAMQLSISLVDYQINDFVEKNIPLMDFRTQYMGRLCTITNTLTTIFQMFGGYLFLRFLGLRNSHFFVPFFLCINAFVLLICPSFAIVSYVYIAIKSADYSIFSIAREMLYIPMSFDEKFRGKAIIDVFAYRSAKALGSFLLIFLQIIGMTYLVGSLSIIIFIFWMLSVIFMFKLFQSKNISFEKSL